MFAVYWMGAAAVLLLIEILTLGLTSIWFAGGAVLAAAAAFLGAPLLLQMVIFVAASCLLFVFTRPLAQKYLNSSVEKTNVEAMIGQHGIVKEAIDNNHGKGLVYVNGMDWSARSLNGEEISEDTEVVIHKIQGVKLIVEALPVPKKQEEEGFRVVKEEEMQDIPPKEEEIPEIWREEEETSEASEEEKEPVENIWEEDDDEDEMETRDIEEDENETDIEEDETETEEEESETALDEEEIEDIQEEPEDFIEQQEEEKEE